MRAVEKAGATVNDLALPPIFEQANAAHQTISAYEAFRSLAFEYDNHRERLGSVVRVLSSTQMGILLDRFPVSEIGRLQEYLLPRITD